MLPCTGRIRNWGDGIVGPKRRRGRVEAGLERQMIGATHIPAAVCAGLRALAKGLDEAETSKDPDAIATAGRVYFDALEMNGLTVRLEKSESDVFADLLREIGNPVRAADTGDATDA